MRILRSHARDDKILDETLVDVTAVAVIDQRFERIMIRPRGHMVKVND
jgi:hypothetical protein